MSAQIKEWAARGLVVVLTGSGISGFFYGIWLFGDAFRAYTVPFAVIWIAVPAFACLLHYHAVLDSFTLAGLRRLQTVLIIAVVAVSFTMFACRDHVRNHFGKQFAQGYHYWRGETEYDDNGEPFYAGDHWTAKTSGGRLAVSLFEWVVLVGVFAIPYITVKATDAAIRKKKSQCEYTTERKYVETYETEDVRHVEPYE